jgi:ABC-type uncharacterized transport system fused permease/ATPase subunit
LKNSLLNYGLIDVAVAFSQVQGAMRCFVDDFSRLADWRAAVHRGGVSARHSANSRQWKKARKKSNAQHPDGHLAFEGVGILGRAYSCLAHGRDGERLKLKPLPVQPHRGAGCRGSMSGCRRLDV